VVLLVALKPLPAAARFSLIASSASFSFFASASQRSIRPPNARCASPAHEALMPDTVPRSLPNSPWTCWAVSCALLDAVANSSGVATVADMKFPPGVLRLGCAGLHPAGADRCCPDNHYDVNSVRNGSTRHSNSSTRLRLQTTHCRRGTRQSCPQPSDTRTLRTACSHESTRNSPSPGGCWQPTLTWTCLSTSTYQLTMPPSRRSSR